MIVHFNLALFLFLVPERGSMGETTIEWTEKSWNPIAAYYEGKRGWM